jgi:multiple RNA-binding domain-containing protein 1
MNIDKAAILNPESGENAAVKLALAETHIIQETKSYLEAQGVLLSSFTTRGRSDTIILVKNIPYGTTTDQIREMFEPHGDLSRVIVPPAGTMAVVEFDKPDEAEKAFRAVAYRRLGNSVVYLEKGPLGMFTEAPVSNSSSTTIAPGSALNAVKIADQELDNDQAEEPSVTGGSTLYVKNLSFSTTQERLTQMFRHLPLFSFARIQTKPDPKRLEGPRLSMGYGFVGFKDAESAKKALKSMQGFVLDGHALHVKFAGRGTEEESKGNEPLKSRSRTTKMIVKNVPFEATRKDIRELFGCGLVDDFFLSLLIWIPCRSYGHLKSVRLPKKFDSRTRGFAFLEFVSRIEAENAYSALRHTHLLGRHLILEWAEEAEQDLDVLRKKAGVGYGEGKVMPGRKRKLDFGKTGEEDVEGLES